MVVVVKNGCKLVANINIIELIKSNDAVPTAQNPLLQTWDYSLQLTVKTVSLFL